MVIKKSLFFIICLLVISCKQKKSKFSMSFKELIFCEEVQSNDRMYISQLKNVVLNKQGYPSQFDFESRIRLYAKVNLGLKNRFSLTEGNLNYYWKSEGFNSLKEEEFPIELRQDTWYIIGGDLRCNKQTCKYYIYIDEAKHIEWIESCRGDISPI